MVTKTEITPAGNSRFAKAGVSCFYDSEVLNSNFVLLKKFSAENPRLRKAAKRYSQLLRYRSMRKSTAVLIFFAWTTSLFGQTTPKEFAIECSAMIELDTSENCRKMLNDLMHLNKLTRGDAGESRNANDYLEQFRKFVYYFDSAYNDTTLMDIVQRDFCPIISCYAFTALVNNPDSLIEERTLVNLVLPFAQKTNSFVNLDWGCGYNEIETFDYLISVVSGFMSDLYLPNLFKFQQSSIVALLDERKKYYSGIDSYSRKQTWEEYSQQYLQNWQLHYK